MVDRNIVVLLALVYAIPSLLLYVTVLFVLLRKKEFSGSFYRLFFLNGLLVSMYTVSGPEVSTVRNFYGPVHF